MVWAEENANLDVTVNSGYQWSFGNGANSLTGLKMGYPCTLTRLTITAQTSTTGTVEVYKNGVATGATVSLTASTGGITTSIAVPFAQGDRLNFRTVSGSGGTAVAVGAALETDGVKGDKGDPGDDAPLYNFAIWAEENATGVGLSTGTNGGYQWSFGNGDDTPSGNGFVMLGDYEIIGMALNVEGTPSGTGTVEIERNGVLTGKSVSGNFSVTNKASTIFGTPLSGSDGDVLNFKTTATAGGDSARVVMFIKVLGL